MQELYLKSLSLMLFVVLTIVPGKAQTVKTDKKLQQALTDLTKDFKGQVGVYVYHLKSNKEAAVNADTIFPTASVVKVPILVGLFDKIAQGEITLTQSLTYDAKRTYGGSGLMQFYKDSAQTDVRTLASLMIMYSDNVTSLWSQELAGGGEAINALMAKLGLEHTRVNSRTKGRESDWEVYGWGQTTPREMATLLVKMRKGELVDRTASDQMYRLMTNGFYTDNGASQIPPYVQTALKTGSVNASRSELLMVNAPGGDYVMYIGTKNIEDQSWTYDNEAAALMRKISAYLWSYFEPKSDWKAESGTPALIKGLPY